RECRMRAASAVSRAKKGERTRAYRAAEAIRHSLRSGFTAYIALSPAIGLVDTVACEYGCQSPVGMTGLRRLDANHGGVRTTRLHRTLQRRSSARSSHRSRETRPAITGAPDAAASTSPRPACRGDHDTPLWWDGMAGNIGAVSIL